MRTVVGQAEFWPRTSILQESVQEMASDAISEGGGDLIRNLDTLDFRGVRLVKSRVEHTDHIRRIRQKNRRSRRTPLAHQIQHQCVRSSAWKWEYRADNAFLKSRTKLMNVTGSRAMRRFPSGIQEWQLCDPVLRFRGRRQS